MRAKRSYVLSLRDPGGEIVIEDVRTRRQARLADFSEIGDQIDRWREVETAPAEQRSELADVDAPKPGTS